MKIAEVLSSIVGVAAVSLLTMLFQILYARHFDIDRLKSSMNVIIDSMRTAIMHFLQVFIKDGF